MSIAPEPHPAPFRARLLARLAPALRPLAVLASLALFAAALALLHGELGDAQLEEVLAGVGGLAAGTVALAIALVAVSYGLLTLYDALALRQAGRTLPYPQIALASFVSCSFAFNLGFGLLTGGSLRYRFYSAAGLRAGEVATVVLFCSLTFLLGTMKVLGLTLLLAPEVVIRLLPLPEALVRITGLALVGACLAYLVVACLRRGAPAMLRGRLRWPSPGIALAQVALASLDLVVAAAVLHTLFPEGAAPPFATFVGIYTVAILLGFLSNVPGGLGVFESAMLLLLPAVPAPLVLGAVLAYRGLYLVLPLLLAAILLAASELYRKRDWARHLVAAGAPRLVPTVVAGGVFIGGAVLLLSVATPAHPARLATLAPSLPLLLLEVAHLVAGLAGLGLLITMRGLRRRLAGAWRQACVLLAVGLVAGLLKGPEYEVGMVLALILGALCQGRRAFYRAAALPARHPSPGWLLPTTVAIATCLWLGRFALEPSDLPGSPWLRFDLEAESSRILRTTLAVALGYVAYVAHAFATAHRHAPPVLAPGIPEAARGILEAADTTRAPLVLAGHRRLLLVPGERALLTYGVRDESWIALGDPIGERAASADLLWAFRDLSERHDGRPVFLGVDEGQADLHFDLGLARLPIGHDARLPLDGGNGREGHAGLAEVRRRAADSGMRIEMANGGGAPTEREALRAVAQAWDESVGPRFLLQVPWGTPQEAALPRIVLRRGAQVLAFASVRASPRGDRLAVDRMAKRPELPAEILDLLLAALVARAAEQGHRWLDLGLVPLPRAPTLALDPIWGRFAAAITPLGGHLPDAAALREALEPWRPQWRGRYLASAGGLELPGVLLDATALLESGERDQPTRAVKPPSTGSSTPLM